MKFPTLLPHLFLLFIAASAEAHDGRSCFEQSNKLPAQERATFLSNCLAQASSPASVQEAIQENKRLSCKQNAKNFSLRGDEETGYIKTCMTKNEAAEKLAGSLPRTKLASRTAQDPSHQ